MPATHGSLYNMAYELKHHDGELIFGEGNSDDRVCVVLSGSVEVSRTVGDMKFILEILQPGEIFGEFALLGPVKRTVRVRAIGETTIGIMDRRFLDYENSKMSSSFRGILNAAVQRYMKMMKKSRTFSFRKHDRISKTLPVKFKACDSLVPAIASNLSEGGVFIRTESPLGVERRFVLKLQIEEIGEVLQIPSQVAWNRKETLDPEAKPLGMAARFYDISEKNAGTLKQCVKRTRKGHL
jgi:CRP-like cAMP-binding protein